MTGAAVEYAGEIRPRHAKAFGRLLYRHVAQVILQNFAGMGWMEKHGWLLVIILIINEDRVLALKRKRQPPVSAHSHGPPLVSLWTQTSFA